MDSYQPFSPSFKSSLMESIKPDFVNPKNPEGFIGSLDVFIHEARDIHNICIYHKQDVYAKLSLTAYPESSVSTEIINGGGRNPVFNQSLRFNVESIESSVKCEVWMLSRIRNYLEDQLLGFALVPLSDVVMCNGKLVDEFTLSSTDLFHSPAGFIKLSLEYTGSSPDLMAIAASPRSSSVPGEEECELNKIEFPDLKIVNENKIMVSEYFGVPCDSLDNLDDEAGIRVVERFSTVSDSTTTASPSPKDRSAEETTFPPPLMNINIVPEHSVVEQDIVDMYMKSMQQFTVSLANMKLPMDIENSNDENGTPNGDFGENQKLEESKKIGSKVFYGSRAFF